MFKFHRIVFNYTKNWNSINWISQSKWYSPIHNDHSKYSFCSLISNLYTQQQNQSSIFGHLGTKFNFWASWNKMARERSHSINISFCWYSNNAKVILGTSLKIIVNQNFDARWSTCCSKCKSGVIYLQEETHHQLAIKLLKPKLS